MNKWKAFTIFLLGVVTALIGSIKFAKPTTTNNIDNVIKIKGTKGVVSDIKIDSTIKEPTKKKERFKWLKRKRKKKIKDK